LLLSLVFSYIYILQGSVEMHYWCGGIYKNYIVHRVCRWKNFENLSIIGKDMDKSKVAHFLSAYGVELFSMMLYCNNSVQKIWVKNM